METRKNWREQLAAVEQRLQQYENEAQKRIRELADRGSASRKELEELVAKVKSGELLSHAAELRSRAEQTGTEVLKRLEGLPEKAFERMGVATRPQIAELGQQVNRLSRRLEKLSKQARRWSAAQQARPEKGGAEKPTA
ncbi:MbeD/MobD family mobilization/exclusion protein [Vulgatibacter sp.]|uniref:MbeD/MobD family mobilization/exclusion protein n=1 Tax=Vulgatibacter sp. TaxID=1971226 RepID=UPI003564B8E5